MQTLYVPKYNLHYRVNPKNPCELQWSRKPFGPMTQWQHAMSFKKPIRALDLDDKTKQGVVVLNDSSTYVGSGVRTWGRKFYPAGTRIYSLYAIGESKMTNRQFETETDPEWDKFCHDVKVFIGKYYIKNIVEWIRKRGNTIEDDEGNKYLNMMATYYDEERSVAKAAKLLSDWVTTNDWQHTEFDDGKIDRQIMLFDKPSENKMKIKVHEASDKRSLRNKIYTALKPINGKYYSDENWQVVSDFKRIVEPLLPENLVLDLYCRDGGYRTSRDGTAKWKEYDFDIYDYETNKDMINGKITCSAAGTVEDPFSRYDVTVTMY